MVYPEPTRIPVLASSGWASDPVPFSVGLSPAFADDNPDLSLDPEGRWLQAISRSLSADVPWEQ